MPVEIYPSAAKIKRNGVYQNLPAFVSESDDNAAQQMIATAESSNVAQYPHNKGDYFRLNDVLYETTNTINVGDNIVVGTNCKVAVLANNISIAENEIKNLNENVENLVTTEFAVLFNSIAQSNLRAVYLPNSPFIFYNNPDKYIGHQISKISLNVITGGTISIGTIKRSNAVTGNASDLTQVNVKETIIVNTGAQEIELQNPFTVDSTEYLFIGLPNNTAIWQYGEISDYTNFMYNESNTGIWETSTGSVGIKIFTKVVKYTEIIQETIETSEENKNDLTVIKEALNYNEGILFKSLATNTSRISAPHVSPFIINTLDYSNAPYILTKIKLKATNIGAMTVGKILKSKVNNGGTYDSSDIEILQTLQIINVGEQILNLNNIYIDNDHYFFVNIPSDRSAFNYDGSGEGLTNGFIYVSNGSYTETNTLIGIDIYGYSNINVRNSIISKYKDKKISILGDSISTFEGYLPSGNATYYPSGTVTNVSDTWWKKLIDALGMTLEINNSWSSSRVTTTAGEESAGCMTRCQNLGSPDVIIVWMGINDFNNEVQLGTYDGSTVVPSETTTFREAYAIMLNKILTAYPRAEVWVCTLPQCERNADTAFPEINGNSVALLQFNKAIKELADAFGVKILDHNKCGLTYQNMSVYNPDQLHPNKFGHSLIANNDIWQMDNAINKRYSIS